MAVAHAAGTVNEAVQPGHVSAPLQRFKVENTKVQIDRSRCMLIELGYTMVTQNTNWRKSNQGVTCKSMHPLVFTTTYWWARSDLNRRPKDYESSALTN